MAHWLGIGLIMIGVMLVGRTAPRTTKRKREARATS
jgi:hypothetical protein